MERNYDAYDYWMRNAQTNGEWRHERTGDYNPEGYCMLQDTDYRVTERAGDEPNFDDEVKFAETGWTEFQEREFYRGFREATGLSRQEADDQWGAFSRALPDQQIAVAMLAGYDSGIEYGQEFSEMYQ